MVFVIKSTTQKRIAQDSRKEICDKHHNERVGNYSSTKCTGHRNCGVASFVEKDYLSQH
jgi:hypothetical protein